MTNFKKKVGCWLHERWRTEFVLLFPVLAHRFGLTWPNLCNRHEHLLKGNDKIARICDWQDSSFLTVCRFFPNVGGRLLKHCLKEWPIQLSKLHEEAGHSNSPKISVILPVGGEDRVALFQCVLFSFFGQTCLDIEIVVVEHGHQPIYKSVCPDGVKYIFLPRLNGQEFNKCMAMNVGVRSAVSPYVLLHDGDVVPPCNYLESILNRLDFGWEAVHPIRFLFDLSKRDSEVFINSDARILPKEVMLIHQNKPGLSTALSKKVYKRLGGHDEQFWGWGGEDNEFLDRLKTVHLYPGNYTTCVHLWHTSAPKKISGNRNNERLHQLLKIPTVERIRILRKQYIANSD